jgi:two-component system sensor histidine kinase KdpD
MKTEKKSISISTGRQYFFATVILFIFIVFLYYIQDLIGYQTVSLILLLIIFLLPLFNFERGPIILAAVISALAWDYYFIPPHFTMYIAKTEDIVMLFMFFIVAVTNGVLTARLKEQKNLFVEKERKSNALYNLVKAFSQGNSTDELLKNVVKQIENTFGMKSVIFFSDENDKLNRRQHPSASFMPDEMEWLAAELSFVNKAETGKTTGSLQDADGLYFPLKKGEKIFGVLGVNLENQEITSDEKNFLRNYISEISSYLEKQQNYLNS